MYKGLHISLGCGKTRGCYFRKLCTV